MLSLHDDMHFGDALSCLQAQQQSLQKHPPYLRDIFYRCPDLAHLKNQDAISVTVKDNTLLITNIPEKFGHQGHLDTLLKAAIDDKNAPIKFLPLLTPHEHQTLIVDWNRTETDFPRDMTVHALFEAQAEKTPNAIAVQSEENSLTYAALNQKANQLAHTLQAQGSSVGKFVALYMERSVDMIISMLAVLKSGATYVPIHPEAPLLQIEHILLDSHASKILVRKKKCFHYCNPPCLPLASYWTMNGSISHSFLQ